MHGGGFTKIFLIISAISLLLDWYVFSGLKTLTNNWASKFLQNIVLWGYLSLSIGVIALMVAISGSFSTASGMRPFHEWVLSIFLVFFVTKLFFVIVLLLGDLGRFFVGLFKIISRPSDRPAFPARRKFVGQIAVLIAAVPFT